MPVLAGIGHITNDTVVEMVCHKSFITPTDLANFLFQEFHNFSVPVQEAQKIINDKSTRLISDEKMKLRSAVKLFRSVAENMLIKNENKIREQGQSIMQQSIFLFKNEKEKLRALKERIKKETNVFCNSANQAVRQFALTMGKDVAVKLNHFRFLVNQNGQQVVKGSAALILSIEKNLIQLKEKLSEKSVLILKDKTVALHNIEKNVNNMSPDNVLRRGYSITLLNGKSIKGIEQVSIGDELETLVFEGKLNSLVQSKTNPGEL